MARWLMALLLLAVAVNARGEEAPAGVREAVRKGLHRLEEGATRYTQNRQCFSCHHQALTIAVLRAAGRHGFAVGPDVLKQQVEFTLETFRPLKAKLVKGQGVPGGNTMTAYALFALEAGG